MARLLGFLPVLGLGALCGSAAAQPFHLEDSLRGSTVGNATGGSFGAEGWTVTGVSDQLWYALPQLRTGSIEFTLANVTLAVLPLPDHEIAAMYEAGHGIGEPIRYAPDFRTNHYKMLIRIYGDVEAGRMGNMKLMWGMCPSGAPGYDACGCEQFFQEPFGDPGPWTGAPVRIRIEWNETSARLLRDGVEVVAVDWSGTGLTFGPVEPHFMLGSPRNDGGLSAMPIGALFSDLVIDGEMGSIAMCPGAGMDAGMPDAGPVPDGGTCAGGVGAIADGIAASWEPGVFPDPDDLNIEGAGGAPSAVAYLRFPPVPGPVIRADLSLDVSSVASADGGSGRVCLVEGSWEEATLTWASRPTVSATCVGTPRHVTAGETVTWDVTSLITPGSDVSLAIVSTDDNGAHYLSREAGGCTRGPRLIYMLAPTPDVPGLDAGSGTDTSAPMDGGRDGGLGPRGTASCGCRAGSGSSGRFVWLLAALTLALARRRR